MQLLLSSASSTVEYQPTSEEALPDLASIRDAEMSFLREFIRFLFARKKYWLVPVFLVLLLVGSLVVFSKGSVIAPLIYTMF